MISQDDIDGLLDVPHLTPPQMLCQFMKAFKGSLDSRLWMKLVIEEMAELRVEDPGTVGHLKEFSDVLYVMIGLQMTIPLSFEIMISEDEVKEINELEAKLAKVVEKYTKYYTPDVVAEAFFRVHESNMSKLGLDGKPILREDGKVLKGPNYKKPDLTDLIKKDAR